MTHAELADFRIRMLESSLRSSQKHVSSLEIACRNVCMERDNLASQVQEMERTLIEIFNVHDNDVAVMGQTIQALQGDLRTSMDEQIRLLAQRRILAKHLRALMHLAHTHQDAEPQQPVEIVIEERPQPLFAYETPRPSLRSRIASWLRMSFAPTAA